VCNPTVLLLDGDDGCLVESRREIGKLFTTKQAGRAIIVSHLDDEAEALCTRIAS